MEFFVSTRIINKHMNGHNNMQHGDDAHKYIAGHHVNCRCTTFLTTGESIDPERQKTIEQLRRKMWEAADREDYERAAKLRDRLRKITNNE